MILNIRCKTNLETGFLISINSSTFIRARGATIPSITKEEKTAIAAALPKCITASMFEDRLDKNAMLSLKVANTNAPRTPESPTSKAFEGTNP